jgi:NADH dehydrogenase FAD-containing subunit
LYPEATCRLDLLKICHFANIRFIDAVVTKISSAYKRVEFTLNNNDDTAATTTAATAAETPQSISFDILSINVGSVTYGADSIPGVSEHALMTRPISSEFE